MSSELQPTKLVCQFDFGLLVGIRGTDVTNHAFQELACNFQLQFPHTSSDNSRCQTWSRDPSSYYNLKIRMPSAARNQAACTSMILEDIHSDDCVELPPPGGGCQCG